MLTVIVNKLLKLSLTSDFRKNSKIFEQVQFKTVAVCVERGRCLATSVFREGGGIGPWPPSLTKITDAH